MFSDRQLELLSELVDRALAQDTTGNGDRLELHTAQAKLRAFRQGDAVASVWTTADVAALRLNDDGEPDETISEREARDVLAVTLEHEGEHGITRDKLADWLAVVEADREGWDV